MGFDCNAQDLWGIWYFCFFSLWEVGDMIKYCNYLKNSYNGKIVYGFNIWHKCPNWLGESYNYIRVCEIT